MKNQLVLLVLFVLYGFNQTVAQNLSQKTNEIQLAFKENSVPSGVLPNIKWISPAFDFTSSAKNILEITAEIEIKDNVKDAKLIVGNSKDGGILAFKTIEFSPFDKKIELKHSLFLPEGSCFISIQVTTKQGLVLSEKRTVLVGVGAEDNLLAANRKDYAVLFATDKYDHWDDLVNPIDDAHAIGKELKEKYGFEVEIVENSTMEGVWEKLRTYSERTFNPQDQLLVFFAGHGHFDESFGEGFVVAKNSLKKDLSRSTYISHNRLRGVISNIPSKHILLMMDVCFGGTLDPVAARTRGADNEVTKNEFITRKLRYRTRKYITSGGKEYVSDGIPGKHSPFAESIIESLRSWGGEDRILTISEMQTYLEKLKQQPRLGSFGDDETLSDFVFVGKQ
jgi:hypothetical protein